ncbi:MAG: UDP-glucose dehydrogenase family protein [Nitrospiria bacterium]
MNISVMGAGYVGLVTGACFAEFGLSVICADIDAERIRLLQNGQVPFYEPGLEELVDSNLRQGRLEFTTDIQKAVSGSRVILIATGTPSNGDGSANISQVLEATRTISQFITDYKIVVTKSTIPVGTTRKLKKIITVGLPAHASVDVVANPEFLREGSALEDFFRPNRVIIGVESIQAKAIMKELYSPFYLIETPIVFTNLETAELIKYATNAFLATKITFINEISNLCEAVGADVHHVAKGLGLDQRIGRKFLHPGPGFGGSCLPKDTAALLFTARENNCNLRIVNAVLEANSEQKLRMVGKIRNALGNLDGKTIGILGLSFKPNTDDVRDAQSLRIIDELKKEGAMIKVFDPAAMENAKKVLRGIEFCDGPYEVAKDSDALVFLTEWNQFRKLDMDKIKSALRSPIIIDLRNIYEPDVMEDMGFTYISIARRRLDLV